MHRNAVQDEEIGKGIDHVGGFELPCHTNGQRLPRELIDDTQHPAGLPVMGSIRDEVIGPNMVGLRRRPALRLGRAGVNVKFAP